MDPRLIRLRVELFTAAQQLTGDDLAAFKTLIDEVHDIVHVGDERAEESSAEPVNGWLAVDEEAGRTSDATATWLPIVGDLHDHAGHRRGFRYFEVGRELTVAVVPQPPIITVRPKVTP
jgi:hypothetical protein